MKAIVFMRSSAYKDQRGPVCVGKNYSQPGSKPGPYTQENPAPLTANPTTAPSES